MSREEQTNGRSALEAAQAFAGPAPEQQQQPAAADWQVRIKRGEGRFVAVFTGAKEDANKRYERERDKLAGGVVRLYTPSGVFVRQASRP